MGDGEESVEDRDVTKKDGKFVGRGKIDQHQAFRCAWIQHGCVTAFTVGQCCAPSRGVVVDRFD